MARRSMAPRLDWMSLLAPHHRKRSRPARRRCQHSSANHQCSPSQSSSRCQAHQNHLRRSRNSLRTVGRSHRGWVLPSQFRWCSRRQNSKTGLTSVVLRPKYRRRKHSRQRWPRCRLWKGTWPSVPKIPSASFRRAHRRWYSSCCRCRWRSFRRRHWSSPSGCWCTPRCCPSVMSWASRFRPPDCPRRTVASPFRCARKRHGCSSSSCRTVRSTQ